MVGAIVGDIVGSRFEFNNHRSKKFKLFDEKCFPTDDSIMTLAVCDAIMSNWSNYDELSQNTVRSMRVIGKRYPGCGYGTSFARWLFCRNPQPYNSFGNGAAMRVSACGWVGKTLEEVKELSNAVTRVTHNHPEGLKGAEATATAVFLARKGWSKAEIREFIEQNYYRIDFTLDEIRPTYKFNETCQDTVPQALEAFFESESFEDAIRNAISVGGDSDTLAAITGAVAEAYYGVPVEIEYTAYSMLDPMLRKIALKFKRRYRR